MRDNLHYEASRAQTIDDIEHALMARHLFSSATISFATLVLILVLGGGFVYWLVTGEVPR